MPAAPSAMPSVSEVVQSLKDEATGMDIDTIVSEVAQARSAGNMNPMVSHSCCLLCVSTWVLVQAS